MAAIDDKRDIHQVPAAADWLDEIEPGAAVAEDLESDNWPVILIDDDAVQELHDAFVATQGLAA